MLINPYIFGTTPPPAGTEFITSVTLSTLRSDFGGCVGFVFTVGASPITVSELGRWVVSGNSQSHDLYLVNSAGAVLGTVNVNMAGATPGTFKYGTLSSPVVLSSATQYGIMSKEENGLDQWYDISPVTNDPAGNTVLAAYQLGVGLPITTFLSDVIYVPTNFKFSL